MWKKMKKVLYNEEKGFTLIELMIVILIIGILVAIAVPIFNVARANAQRRTCQANLRTLNGAVQQYHADEEGGETQVTTGNWISLLVNGGYIKKTPTCPSDTDAYQVDDDEQFICPNNAAGEVTGHTY